jgi:methylmalonyl-CoA carboxyltransferase 12S subunit
VRNDTAVIDTQETTMSAPVSDELFAALQDVRSQLASLAERVAGLEQLASMSGAEPGPVASAGPVASRVVEAPHQTSSATPTSSLADASGISEEEVLAISAALAAWFGVHAHIRQIRLIRTGAWAQQGRVTIQASHRLYH